jgi:uncharacterized protein VirK/YbjX
MTEVISMLVNTAPLVHRSASPWGLLKRAKYVMRGFTFAGYTREWFDFLQQPELAVVISRHHCLYHKLQRPYLNCILNTRQRLEALQQHYNFVLENFSSEMMVQVYRTSGLALASFTLDELGQFELRLSFAQKQKEGDLAIRLVKVGAAKELHTLSFSVWKYRGPQKEIFIGGLQGSPALRKDLVIDLTHALHGLRPKALMLFALQQLTTGWGISSIRAVSDSAHIYRHFQKRKILSTCYDEFWRECGGRLASDGLFDLPAEFAPRQISALKANKRQMYRRRYQMLADFADQIRERLHCPSSEAGTDANAAAIGSSFHADIQ